MIHIRDLFKGTSNEWDRQDALSDLRGFLYSGKLKDVAPTTENARLLSEAVAEIKNLEIENPEKYYEDIIAWFIRSNFSLQREVNSTGIDDLTGIYDRKAFLNKFTVGLMSGSITPESKLKLIFLDVDRFKPINDTYGHPEGDHVLREIALRLSASVGEAGVPIRMGGDEFVLLLASEQSDKEIEAQLLSAIENITPSSPNLIESKYHDVGASIGIEPVNMETGPHVDVGAIVDRLLKDVDEKMYLKKAERREKGRRQEDAPTLQSSSVPYTINVTYD